MKTQIAKTKAICCLLAVLALVPAATPMAQDYPAYDELFVNTDYRSGGTSAFWDTANEKLTLHPFAMMPVDSVNYWFSSEDVAVSGGIAVVGTQSDGIVLFDIIDPQNMTLITSVNHGDYILSVAIDGELLVAGTMTGVRFYDISVPAVPGMLSFYSDPQEYRDVVIEGDLLFCATAGAGDGIVVLDISDPAIPGFLGSEAVDGNGFGIGISGNHAFVTSDNMALSSYDISNPATPVPMATFSSGIPGRHVVVDGGYAYVAADASGFLIIDISDPGNLFLAGANILPYPAAKLAVAGDRVYVAHTSAGLQAFDVSDPSAPEQVTPAFNMVYAQSVAIAGEYAYPMDATGHLYAVEIAKEIQPAIIAGDYSGGGVTNDVVVAGNLAYIVRGSDGLDILDVTDPVGPTLVGSYADGLGQGYKIQLDGNFVYIANGTEGLRILDVTDPFDPSLVVDYNATTGDVNDVEIAGNLAILADATAGLIVMDISIPSLPTELSSASEAESPRGLAVAGNHAYVADPPNGLMVFDITDPNLPNLMGQDAAPNDSRDVALAGNYAYVTDWGHGMWIYDVSTPAIPLEVGDLFTVSGHGFDIALRGNTVFLTDDTGLRSVDVTNPALPISYSHTGIPGNTRGFDLAGDFAFVATQGSGLQVLKVYERDVDPDRRVAQSLSINAAPGAEISHVRLTTVQTGSVLWQMSSNGGVSWVAVPPNGLWQALPDTAQGSSLRWRATLYYNQYGVIPECDLASFEWQFGDSDFDGVANGVDACPAENASYFDHSRDGCYDAVRGGRHVEYWPAGSTVTYSINQFGVPGLTGSEFPVLQAAMSKWTTLSGTSLGSSYSGLSSADTAVAFDGENLITAADDEYDFGSHVIAVGITNSFTAPTYFQGRLYSPGEMVDADMILNPLKSFKTDSEGTGIDLESVATHEAGHLFGLSHSVILSSTMFYALGTGTDARTLEVDDIVTFTKAYPAGDPKPSNHLGGTIEDGITGDPVAGALVYVIDAVSGDTSACDVSLPDGSYQFAALDFGDYYVAIHPFDQSYATYYTKPAWVNWYVDSVGVSLFVPEYWDNAESNSDNPQDRDAISLIGGGTTLDFITNVDLDGPQVTGTWPGNGGADISVETSVLVRFDEPIDHTTLEGEFVLYNNTDFSWVGGTAWIMDDDSVVSFRPFVPLDFSTTYLCTVGTGLLDKYGNPMAADYSFSFDTEVAPPLSLSSVVPGKGAAGSMIVLNGFGFDTDVIGENRVLFPRVNLVDTMAVPVESVSPTQLVAIVPPDAGTGWVAAQVGDNISSALSFDIIPEESVPRGFVMGTTHLGSLPRTVSVMPGGGEAAVATVAGVSVVNIDPGSPGFTNQATIPVPDGADDLAVTPDGNWIYAVESAREKLHAMENATKSLVATLEVGAMPYGIAIDPGGKRAFVSTDDGEIQVWDVTQGSPNFRKRVGVIASPDANFEGSMAIDPAGDYLLAITGTGKMLAFDLGPDTFLVSVPAGVSPSDIVVETAGKRAYISDETGSITIVSLEGMFTVTSVPTGGSLRGMSASPGGRYLYAANRELNLLDVVDLDPGSPDWWEVATTIPLGINPVDVDITPGGEYAVSILEDTQELVVTAVGVGPILDTVMPRVAASRSKVVMTGAGFGTDLDSLRVSVTHFSGGISEVTPERSTGSVLTFEVPTWMVSGPVSVSLDRGTHVEVSNSQYLQILTFPGDRTMRPAALLVESVLDVTDALAISPDGDLLLVGTEDGEVMFFDIGTGSGSYHKMLGTPPVLGAAAVNEIVFTPDGRRAYVSIGLPVTVFEVDADRYSPGFGTVKAAVDLTIFPGEQIYELAVSPDGAWLLAYNFGYTGVAFVDIAEGSPTKNIAGNTVSVDGVTDVAFHPGGEYAYCAAEADAQVHVIDMTGSGSPTFQQVANVVDLVDVYAGALAFTPSGRRCYVLGRHTSVDNLYIYILDALDPSAPVFDGLQVMGSSVVPYWTDQGRIVVSPEGSDALYNAYDEGFRLIDLVTPTFPVQTDLTAPGYLVNMYHAYTPDNSRVYAVSSVHDSVMVFDFTAADSILAVSGDGQTGVMFSTLSSPLMVKATKMGGVPASGVGVTFRVTSGGGTFTGSNASTQTATTDENGVAGAYWLVGPYYAPQTVSVSGYGLSGSPVTFSATSVVDPATLPLELVSVSPADGDPNASVTTTIVADFSRGVDTLTVGSSSFFFHPAGNTTPVQATVGYASGFERVSLTPLSSLDYSTTYEIEVLSAIQDTSANALTNPDTITFTTGPAPPPMVSAVAPPSATAGVVVTVSGSGFDTDFGLTTVLFGDTPMVPVAGGVDHVNVEVPPAAGTGALNLAVVANGDTSNTIPFFVLVPTNTAADEIIATVHTGTAIKGVTVSPDGSMSYAVSPTGGVVVPTDLDNLISLPPIQVGSYPVSIDIHPDGNHVYVANFQSGDISIIDSDPVSLGYHTVDSTLVVGGSPMDLVVSPDGDRVYVSIAPPDSLNLGVIDSDDLSANFHTLIATVKTGTSSKSVTISPDGTRLYFGTDDGYIVMDVENNSYSVIATVQSGKGTKTVTMSPDGTLLFVLTTQGDVVIYNVEPGSEGENEIIATVQTGKGTKTVTVSPDGTLLYLVQEESDIILVVELTIINPVGIADEIPPIDVTATIIDTVYAGEDPEVIVFSPANPSLALVTNSGPQTLTFLETSFVGLEVPADTMVPPHSTVSMISLNGFSMKNTTTGDYAYSYTVTTDGAAVFAAVQDPGALSGTTPVLAPGAEFAPPAARLEVPVIREPAYQRTIYRVTAVGNPAFVKADTSMIIYEPPIPVAFSAFTATPVSAGVNLAWDLSLDEEVAGFRVYRRRTDVEPAEAVVAELGSDKRVWLDRGAAPDCEYRYTVAVVMEDGSEVRTKSVTAKTLPVELALRQNFPNPFNPVTTIEFSLPSRGHVELTVFNVEGKRVATLIDRPMEPGRQRAVWRGKNQKGNEVSSGIYFYRLTAGNKTLTRKMVLIR